MLLPFALLLSSMAVFPMHWPGWWRKHYAKLAVGMAAVTVSYYLWALPPAALRTVRQTALEYAGFIALTASLYVVSGGIRLRVGGERTPGWNTLFLAAGGLAANAIGTTGASMLLIRPWLEVNRSRIAPYHIVFFIFIISNVGGGLTPMGDPPLLVGYLEGVPFFWVARRALPMWSISMAFLLTVFYLIDRKRYSGRPRDAAEKIFIFDASAWLNLLFLGMIAATLVIRMPELAKDGIMVALAAASYLLTGRFARQRGEFRFHPIVEVGVLFLGLFATMMPALDRLREIGGHYSPGQVYWSAGALSAFLDSSPAYLAFFKTVAGHGGTELPEALVTALSVSAVLFGAVTYIGNAPNLMIKAIVDDRKIPSPSFFEYLFKWAVPVMLPLLAFLWLVFFAR